jgi:protein TonB
VGDTTYTVVEIESEFPGGAKGWIRYLTDNFHYPKAAVRKRIQGEVVVQFIVDKQGKVTEVAVIKSVHPLLDEEAMRLIKESPDWKPAMQNGKKVKSYKKQPIVFRLE